MIIENLIKQDSIIKELKDKKIISEELTRSDIEIIKRLIVSALESFLMNLFTRRSINLSSIAWRE
jgi:hypothetical protein